MNKINLIGNLGKNPEHRYMPDGKDVANFSLAVNETFKGERKTEWFNVTVFGKQAETVAAYLVKGRQVAVEGRLRTRSWEYEGKTYYRTEVVANRVEFLGGKPATEPAYQTDHDVPF